MALSPSNHTEPLQNACVLKPFLIFIFPVLSHGMCKQHILFCVCDYMKLHFSCDYSLLIILLLPLLQKPFHHHIKQSLVDDMSVSVEYLKTALLRPLMGVIQHTTLT